MKRSLDSTESPKAPRRQKPVSYQFCRAKKLRCSFELPCASRVAKLELRPFQHQPAPQALSLHSLHERVQRIERSLGISSEKVPIKNAATSVTTSGVDFGIDTLVLLAAMFISAQELQMHLVDSPKNGKLRQNTPLTG
ncbi:hypothetical protein CISG_00914 [Coccidioides immitis RMSCC 3703]|uniref:Zn(2)-C6 fungal-type domain-containing protein n=1 Tax=Coccidioides immitis RMSCC 3703 TaxID=454286 RepID=A0A0J8QSD6_COCIT|nr:hypothetical protein CISG_00914 [Coccidioides immitis RMSCC 3703]